VRLVAKRRVSCTRKLQKKSNKIKVCKTHVRYNPPSQTEFPSPAVNQFLKIRKSIVNFSRWSIFYCKNIWKRKSIKTLLMGNECIKGHLNWHYDTTTTTKTNDCHDKPDIFCCCCCLKDPKATGECLLKSLLTFMK
jgi:hypothetical protein